MANFPDDFTEGMEEGAFPASEARAWLQDNPMDDDAASVRGFIDAGLSMEWAFAATEANLPHPSDWESATIQRDSDGSWDVIITTDSGDTAVIDAAASDEIASDNIWGDFWFHVVDEYDIDVEKEINYA
jgi:hypothetical protein